MLNKEGTTKVGSIIEYRKGGVYHRTNGPAWEDHKYGHRWYVDGVPMCSYKEFQTWTECSDEYILFLKLKWGEITDYCRDDERWR